MRLVLLLLCLPLWGQVRIKATPEPMVVLRSLRMRSLGLWTLAICNDSEQDVALSRERLTLAFPPSSGLRIVSSERAREALAYAQRRTWQARVASVMRYGLMASTAGTALAGSQKNVVSGLALGAVLADQVARRLENEIPRLDPWLAGLSDDPLTLGPGQCGSRTVFAALQKEAHVLEVTIK